MRLKKSITTLTIGLLFNLTVYSQKHIGINIGSIEDYSTELVFSNVFLQGREWTPYELWGAWDSGVNVPMGANGYPLEIPYNDGTNPAQLVKTLIFTDFEDHYPGGDYKLIVDGVGVIILSGAVNGTYTCPYDGFITIDNTLGGILLEIMTSDVADPIHDIRLLLPGTENTYQTDPFNPDFIDFISDFETIRFMDFMKTNGSTVENWSDRTSKTSYTQSKSNGVSYEYMIDLCNTTQKNAWICIPHRATDAYIAELATLFRDSLDSNLKIYVEYSNEVWNGIFSQSQYAIDMAISLGYTGQTWEQNWQYYAKRSADVHTIFEATFTDDNRIINVVASQMVAYVADYILDRYSQVTYNPSQVQAEVIAVAPYFGGSLADDIGDAGLENSITVNDLLDSLEFSFLPQSFSEMSALKTVSTDHNIDFMAYEGGQHLVTYSYNGNDNFVDTLVEVNRNARMQDLYCQYFDNWYDVIDGDLFCAFSSHGIHSIWGSWGIKEYMSDTLAPKYLALKNCVFENSTQSNSLNEKGINNNVTIYPQPSLLGLITISHNFNNPNVILYDLQGRIIDFEILSDVNFETVIKINNFNGVGIIHLNDAVNQKSIKFIVH